MTLDRLIAFIEMLPAVEADYPFGPSPLVFKVGGKIFAILDDTHLAYVSLKASPPSVVDLCNDYAAVEPGYHLNKRHWITVRLNAEPPARPDDRFVFNLIRDSHALVVQGLPGTTRRRLDLRYIDG